MQKNLLEKYKNDQLIKLKGKKPLTNKKFPPLNELVGIDFETIPGTYIPELLAMSWSKGAVVFDLAEEDIKKPFFEWLDKCYGIVAHNVKFELSVLDYMGYDINKLNGRFHDSMIAVSVTDTEKLKGLKSVAKEFNIDLMEWEDVVVSPRNVYKDYCKSDAITCRKIFNHYFNVVKKMNADGAYNMELDIVYWQIEAHKLGIKIDLNLFNKFKKKYEKKINKYLLNMNNISSGIVNVNSNLQIADLLFNKFKLKINPKFLTAGNKKTGLKLPSVDSEALKYYYYSENTPKVAKDFIENLLEYKKYMKLLNTYLSDKFLSYMGSDGRIKSEPDSLGARTGRFSYRNPNMQNIPKRGEGGELRSMFIPEDGYYFIRADLSQFEYRLLAHFSEDPFLLNAYNTGRDLHEETGALFGVSRDVGKQLNFAVIYGIGADAIAQKLNIPLEKSFDLRSQYFARFAKVKDFIENAFAFGKYNKYIQTISGRVRTLNNYTHDDSAIRRIAVNTIIQGANAEIIKMIICRQRRVLKPYKIRCILQVHDELVFEVPEKIDKNKAVDLIRDLMVNTYKLKVPIECSIDVLYNWKESA